MIDSRITNLISNIATFFDKQVSPVNVTKESEDYYRSKTFNSFTLIALLIIIMNTIFRFIQALFFQNSLLGYLSFVTSFFLLLLVFLLYLVGKSKFYNIGFYIFPMIPILSIWIFLPMYLNNNFNPNYTIELYIVNPTMILILGLIVAGLLLSLKELVFFSILTFLDLFLFYGVGLQYSNDWLIPRFLVLTLICGFMLINAFFRITLYHFLTESNKQLTKEVEINKITLIEERTVLYSLIANLREGVAICDDKLIPKIVNNNFTTYFSKITKENFDINTRIDKNITFTNPFFKFLHNTINENSVSDVIEIGNSVYLIIGNHLHANLDSKDLGLMIEIHDITNLKVVDMLEKNFRKVVMHELRTPTTSLKLAVSNLTRYWDKLNDDDRKKLLKSLENQTSRFTEIVKNISNLSDLESNKTTNKINVDFKTFFSKLTEEFVVPQDTHTILIEKSFQANFLLDIDLNLIFEACRAIIDNAKKFSNQETKIFVNLYLEEQNFVIEIKDHGMGIEESELPFVFNKFYKGKKAENIQGEGLGLSVAKEIMLLHNGDVIIESKINEGTKVKVILPIVQMI